MKRLHYTLFCVVSYCMLFAASSLDAANAIKWYTKTNKIFEGQSFPVSLIAIGSEVSTEPSIAESDSVSLEFIDKNVKPMGSQNTFEYRYTCILKKPGIHQLPHAELNIDNTIVSPATKAIEAFTLQETKDLKVSVTLSEEECYVGQPLFIKIRWESTFPLSIIRSVNLTVPALQNKLFKSFDVTKVDADGGDTISVPVNNHRVISRCWKENINETTTYYLESTKIIVPQKPGNFDIAPVTLICSAARHDSTIIRSLKSSFNQYPDYFNNEFFEKDTSTKHYNRYRMISESPKLKVKPVPRDGRPELFNGLVDRFSLKVDLNPKDATIGTPLTVTMTVENTQFPEVVELPRLSDIPGFNNLFMIPKWRSPGIVKNGKKVFTQTIRPFKIGLKAFPALKIPYFNSITGKFEFIESEAIPLTLQKNEEFTQYDLDFTDGSVAKTEVTKNESGIMYNYKVDPEEKQGETLYSKKAFIIVLILFLLITGGIIATAQIRQSLSENIAERRQRKALRNFAKQHCTSSADLESALRAYFADKLLLNASAITIHDIEKHLSACPDTKKLLEPLQNFYEEFDKKTFSTDDEPMSMKKKSSLLPVISKIDKMLVTCIIFGVALFGGVTVDAAPTTESLISQADKHFEKAMEVYETDITESQSEYTFAAMKYSKASEQVSNYAAKGKLLYNAGNAWYFASKPGQAIYCYLMGKKYLPYDSNLDDNLNFTRTQTTDSIDPPITTEWVQAALFFHYFISIPVKFWLFVLSAVIIAVLTYCTMSKKCYIDKRIVTSFVILLVVMGGSLAVNFFSEPESQGVIVANDVMPYKGNSYAYEQAFATPLHAGTEFIALEKRGEWTLIKLKNNDECWLPDDTFKLIQ